MNPHVYIDSRERAEAFGSSATDLIIFDIGRDRPIAYITLPLMPPFRPRDQSTQIEWCKRELTKLTDKLTCAKAVRAGRIEFEVADIKTGTLYSIDDVVAELIQAVSLPGGIHEHRRAEFKG